MVLLLGSLSSREVVGRPKAEFGRVGCEVGNSRSSKVYIYRMNFVSLGSKSLTGVASFTLTLAEPLAFKTGDSCSEGFLPFEASQWQLTAAWGEALLLLARMAETRSWWVARGGGDGPPRWPPPMTITDGVWTVHQHQSIYKHICSEIINCKNLHHW